MLRLRECTALQMASVARSHRFPELLPRASCHSVIPLMRWHFQCGHARDMHQKLVEIFHHDESKNHIKCLTR